MSKYVDVTLIPTAGPDRKKCLFKLGHMPVRVCRKSVFWTINSDWYTVQPGPFSRYHDVMLLMWYDGISCFVQSCTGYTVAVNDKVYGMDMKIDINNGDTILIKDCWKVVGVQICLQIAIHYKKEQIGRNVEVGSNRSDRGEHYIRCTPDPKKQKMTFQPSQDIVSLNRSTDTHQNLNLENPTLKDIHPRTTNEQLQRFMDKSIQAGTVAERKKFYENKNEHKMPVRKAKALHKHDKLLSKPKMDRIVQSISEQCHEYKFKEKIKKTNIKEKSNERQRITLSCASNCEVSGNEIRGTYCDGNQRNTQKENTTASHHMLSSLASDGATDDDDVTYNYCEMNQSNTQQEGQHESDKTLITPNHGDRYESNMYTQDHSEIDSSICEEENTTASHHMLSSLASHGATGDDDVRDNYCEMNQNNTQQEGQHESDKTLITTNHGDRFESNMYTQDHSKIDSSICEGLPMKGVSNMGMTCYANGIFQILAQTKLFLSAMKPLVELPKRPLTNSLWKVLEGINHPSQYFTDNRNVVRKLLDVIAKYSSFSSCRQDDCLEFLLHILERLKEENQQSTSMFEMNLQTVIEHETHPGKHVDKCDIQLSYHLLVPFYREQNKDNPTVASCLNKMLNIVESFSGKELPCRYCSRTEAPKQSMTKHFVVSRSPDILILQIGRVEHMKFRTYSNLKKKNELVEYEHILDIDEVQWDGCKRIAKRNNYQLYGVVLHAGIIECGHYYCFVKHRKTSEWFYCNDSLVYQIHARMVLNDTNAYLLFYERIILEV